MKNRLPVRFLMPALAVAWLAGLTVRAADDAGPQLAHIVIFTLKDHSKASRDAMVAACEKYLKGHEGTVSFSVGTIAEDVKEPVSDREFDVAVHLVFRDKAAAARYQSHPRHRTFIEENKASWAKVRVFDSYLAAP